MLEKIFSSKELSIEDYHKEADHISSSSLKHILNTPAHYLASFTDPDKDTEALALGRLIHLALLEPDVFEQRFAIVPKCDRRTTEGKAAYAAWQEANQGKILFPAEDIEFLDKLRRNIRAHKDAYKLFALPGEEESSIFWTDDETGLRLKTRPDKQLKLGSAPIYVSLKTTAVGKAGEEPFYWETKKYLYHMTEVMYMDSMFQRYGVMPQQVTVVVEKKTMQICTYQMDAELYEEGYEMYRKALRRVVECRKSGIYPGYQPLGKIVTLSRPKKKATWGDYNSYSLAA